MTDKLENYKFDNSDYVKLDDGLIRVHKKDWDTMKQEVQGLREALQSLYNIAKFTHGKGAAVGKHWLALNLELMKTKQALQRNLTTKEQE